MESNEIKEAAEKYADENNSAYTNDYYGFIAGAIWHQSKTSTLSNKLKEAFSGYVKSEGCSCCQDVKSHKKFAIEIGELLGFKKYDDGSGYDFYNIKTQPK